MAKGVSFKRCAQAHIIGQMRVNGSGGEALELFRQAVDYAADLPEQVDVIAVIVGTAYGIRCSICGEAVEWHEASRA